MKKLNTKLFKTTIAIILFIAAPNTLLAQADEDKSGYVSVNGLEMYYEIYNPEQSGTPVVLLHGAFGNVEGAIGTLAAKLDSSRKIITLAMQGHGRTADIDRPLSVEQMAEDVAEALEKLSINQVDIFGYSMGGGIALQLTGAYPQLVRKMIIASAAFSQKGNYPKMDEMMAAITPKMFANTPIKQAYDTLSSNPDHFPILVEKIKKMSTTNPDWNYKQQVKAIKAPALLIFGDADIVRPEHAVKFYRLLGGGRLPNLRAIPHTQLAILPGTTHIGVMQRLDWIVPMIDRFLEQPMPKEKSS